MSPTRSTPSPRTVGTPHARGGRGPLSPSARTYPDPVEDVWDACTNAERIPRWFLPVSGELRLGGRYQLEGNAGGIVERCDPPRLVRRHVGVRRRVSWIEVRLDRRGRRPTAVQLEHIAHVDDARWAEFGPGAVGVGWDSMLLGLTMHLEGDASITPDKAMEWLVSPEGVRFVTESSEAWCAAAIAAGEEPAAAAAAAKRTTAAYTATE